MDANFLRIILKIFQFTSEDSKLGRLITTMMKNRFRACLKMITVKHVTIAVGLIYYYHELAKAQYGASKVYLLP